MIIKQLIPIICLFVFFTSSMLFAISSEWTIHSIYNEQEVDTIINQIHWPISIGKINWISDISIDISELNDLIGFDHTKHFSASDMQYAIAQLMKINRFQQISITLNQVDDAMNMELNCKSSWILGKIKFKGLSNAGHYYHCYPLQIGETFDIETHHAGIKRIAQALCQDGYRDAQVFDYLEYDHIRKLITAHIILQPRQQYRIKKPIHIKIITQQDDERLELVKKKIKKQLNDALSKKIYNQILIERATQSVKNYLSKKGYGEVTIELNEQIDNDLRSIQLDFVIYITVEKYFFFKGNHFFSKEQLYNNIFDYYSPNQYLPINFLINELLQQYYEVGFWKARITATQGKNVTFTIDEGPRAKIKQIEFKGHSFNEQVLTKKFFFPCLKKSFFDATTTKNCLMNLLRWYVKQGFWDIKLLKQSFQPLPTEHEFLLEIILDEGKQRLLGNTAIVGFGQLEESIPHAIKKNSDPVPFDPYIMQEQREWLMRYFNDKGHLYVRLSHELSERDDAVNIIWTINEGPCVKFGKTIIAGTSTISHHALQRMLAYKEGDFWNKDKITKTFEQLQHIGIFDTIYLSADKAEQAVEYKTIILKLVDDDPFEIRLRLGFQQVSKNLTFRPGTTYKIGGAFIFKNPTNNADLIRFDADITRFYRNLCLQYTRPWMFELPIILLAKVYSNTYLQPVVQGSAKTLYEAFQQGSLLGFTHHHMHFDSGINLGIESMETTKLSKELAAAINFEPELVDKKALLFFLEPNILIDFLNNKMNPSHGSLSIISCKINIPFDKRGVTFFKLIAEQSLFASWYSLIFGLHVRLGHVFGKNFTNIMPPDRFYLGGEMSLRGYAPDLAPPLGVFIEDNGKRLLVPQGGKSMFNINFELRFPVYWKNLQAALFQDFGVLIGDSFHNIKKEFGLASTGFGLRYLTPIGPLRFDIGWKWHKTDPEESRFAWFLTLGQAF